MLRTQHCFALLRVARRWRSGLCALLVAILMVAPATARADEVDPWHGLNRGVFQFNDTLDTWVLAPVAKGWDWVLPDPAQDCIGNFFANLSSPVSLANQLLQAKPVDGGKTLGRFLINTALGFGGLLDVAESIGLEGRREDFGQTLAVWGVPSGPYLVLPLLGPSNPRDALALFPDSILSIWPYAVDPVIAWSAGGVQVVNTRSLFLDEVETAKETSLDYYTFVRDAHLQSRAVEIRDGEQNQDEVEDDLYFYDE